MLVFAKIIIGSWRYLIAYDYIFEVSIGKIKHLRFLSFIKMMIGSMLKWVGRLIIMVDYIKMTGIAYITFLIRNQSLCP